MNTSIWTKEEIDEQICIYKEALKKCASGASYTIGSRSLTRQDIPVIREHLSYLERERAALTRGRGPFMVALRWPSDRRLR